MAKVSPPYFFDEFLRPIKRKEPTPRERALGFTLKDLDWLHTLYYATDAARQNRTLHGYCMRVERLLINRLGQRVMPLAGTFIMSPTPDAEKAVLYTPYGGLELFDSRADLLIEMEARLRDPDERRQLLHFLSITERDELPTAAHLSLTTSVIEGAVMQDQESAIRAGQYKNVTMMLQELRKLPTLDGMLHILLGIMARSYFPGLNQADTRVNFFSRTTTDDGARWVASLPLNEALLQFYVKHAWPTDQTHTFVNTGYDPSALTPQQRAEDQQRWDSVVEQTSAILSRLLNSLLQTYWNEDIKGGESRLQLFARVLSDKFRADLLFKHQDEIVSSDESRILRAMLLPNKTLRDAADSQLKLEKVRVHAPFQHYVDLASTLMMSNSHAYLYTQSRGLQVLKDLKDLTATLLSMLKAAGHEDELLNFMSVGERNVFIGMDHIQVHGQPVADDVFLEMIEDVVTKQFDNLDCALGLFRRSAGSIDLAALLDSALDVRMMLDSRLLEQTSGGRWTVHPITSGNGRPSTVQAEKAKLHVRRLETIETALALERSQHHTLRDLVAHALNMEIAKRHLNLKADDIHINTYASQAREQEDRLPQQSSNMVQHFIARLAQQSEALTDSLHTGLYGKRDAGRAFRLPSLSTQTFNAIIEQVLKSFVQSDLRTLPHLLLEKNQTHLSHGLLQGLIGEARLRRLSRSLPEPTLALLDASLNADGLTRVTRHGLNGFIPDAFGLTLNLGLDAIPQALANCFVLTERGGIDPHNSGTALLWTPRCGYEAFASVKVLLDALEQRLQNPLERLPLLENMPVSRRLPHQSYRLGPLQRIDDDLLKNRQQTYSDFIRDEIDHVLSMGLNAQRFQYCMDRLIRRAPPSNLPRAIAIARAMILQQALPVWLGMATPRDQILQAELIEQYRVSAPDERDYLHGIRSIRESAQSVLASLLKARFPEQDITPDNVLIPGNIDLTGNIQTLTDFALRHLPELNGDAIRPRSRTATPLPATLDGNAVVQLVRQLDLKKHFQQQLTAHLKSQTAGTQERRELFCRQLPWQVMQYAHQHMLDERLSASAWGFIQQVFDMPDALARAAVRGAQAVIRPLELIATEGAAKVKALGCYLIGPTSGAPGPVVLYAPYSPTHSLKEYSNDVAFLNEFITPGALQDWVLEQLETAHQATYRNLLNQRFGKGPSDIRLGVSPITGNLLTRLFDDNAEMLLKMLASQFSRLGKSTWEAVTSLLTQGIPKGLQFMAGKLAYPLVVWRSYKLFKASAEDLQEHHWHQALKMFALGVAEMATLRGALEDLLPQTAPPEEPVTQEPWLQPSQPAATTLGTLDVTEPERTRLQAFESHDVALDDLEKTTQPHLYRDRPNIRNYVPLAGKVYPVKKTGDGWRLSKGELRGPYVQQNAQGEWTLDLDRHNPRYGKTLSRYAGRLYTRSAERSLINIEAVGMQEITALSNWKAQCIDEALNVATYYTVTCKRNLVHFTALRDANSRLGRFFSELFGIVTLTTDQVQRIERRIDEVLDELINHTLVGPDSKRFVSGTPRYSPQDSYAFVLPDDAQRKIYLLDRFFDPHMDMYQNRLNTPFNLSAHARATVLIHEITHIRSSTEDLAYLDSMRPFPDLINVNAPGGALIKTDLEDLRETALSLATPVTMLFKAWDAVSQLWEDFGDNPSTHLQMKKVLSTTGATSLADARSIFMSNADKRIDTILANADSVTYLISELGRTLDTGA
ncbi:hypothetical protein BFW88_12615 [Pseudomonas fluorescens]|nr:hypothetical protein BFW88_12615 [Pseudomonas fluorescens]OPB10662.1 hypothetical protein BFW92_12570 [Pseudomonas fluorescens]OPB22048.1 hypothetical protein BFW93_12600 [Pseudomonas fluorescens]